MFSPGQFYQLVPTDPEANGHFRRALLLRAKHDPTFQRGIEEMCRQDILFFTRAFVWQFNPDLKQVGPFIPWSEQEDALRRVLRCIDDQRDFRWPKSRYVGVSWLCLIVIVWLCVFHRNIKCFAMSRDADTVDTAGDPDSLFWKVRFIHEHLPTWMVGALKARQGGEPGIIERKMAFEYERTNSFCSGDATVIASGVGGRATFMLVDEFGRFKNGAETYDFTSDTSNCRGFVGTHSDTGGMFYELCFDPKFSYMREICLHWSHHPDKRRGLYRYDEARNQIEVIDTTFDFDTLCAHCIPKHRSCEDCERDGAQPFKFVMENRPLAGPFPGIRSPWYDYQCLRRSPRDVSMNLDIDPKGSSDQFFEPWRIAVLKAECLPPLWTGNLIYNKETGRPVELVRDPKGLLKLWINPRGSCHILSGRAGAGVDVSAGSGATPSCLSLFNAETGVKILEYVDALIYAPDFASFVVAVCRTIQDRSGAFPLLGWEIQGSPAFERRVRDLGYNSIYILKDEDVLGRPRNLKGRPGVNCSGPEQKALMELYRHGLYNRLCRNDSAYSLDESLFFVYSSQGVEYRGRKKPRKVGDEGSGAKVHHGDIVQADAIAYKMITELGYNRSEARREENKIPSPGTSAWREWMFEHKRAEEYEWA
jgi:hypothetical protein